MDERRICDRALSTRVRYHRLRVGISASCAHSEDGEKERKREKEYVCVRKNVKASEREKE